MGTRGKPIARRIKRHSYAEEVARLEVRDIEVLPAAVTLADGSGERAAREVGVGKGEEMHRAGVGSGRIACARVPRRANRQPTAAAAQSNGLSKPVACIEVGAVNSGDVVVVVAEHQCKLARACGGSDGDVFRIKQHGAPGARAGHPAESELVARGNLDRAAGASGAWRSGDVPIDCSLLIGPQDHATARSTFGLSVRAYPNAVVHRQKLGVREFVNSQILAALVFAADAHRATRCQTARVDLCGQELRRWRGDINATARPDRSRRKVIPRGRDLLAGNMGDRAAARAARVDD